MVARIRLSQTVTRAVTWALAGMAALTGLALLVFQPRPPETPAPVQVESAPVADIIEAPAAPAIAPPTPPQPAPERRLRPEPVARAATIEFPNGELVDVTLKPWPRGPALGTEPGERLKDDLDALRALADAGNTTAAMVLYHGLEQCRDAFTTEASLNEAVTRLKRDRMMTYASPDKKPTPVTQSTDVDQMAEAFLIKPSKRCAGISQSQIAESKQWLQKAADAGDLSARFALGFAALGTTDAVTDFTQLWNEGNVLALQSLQIALTKAAGDQSPDNLYIYAYNLIELKLYEAAAATDRSRSYNIQLQALGDRSNYLQGLMDPQDTQRATELAIFLIRNNPNCCIGNW